MVFADNKRSKVDVLNSSKPNPKDSPEIDGHGQDFGHGFESESVQSDFSRLRTRIQTRTRTKFELRTLTRSITPSRGFWGI